MATETVYRSKIGAEILIPILAVLGTVTSVMLYNRVWIGMIICALVILFFVNIYTHTFYKITADSRLIIKCGIIESFDINILEIEWVRRTREWLSSPALSTDRLEINYKGGRVLISPKDMDKFILNLREINPGIKKPTISK